MEGRELTTTKYCLCGAEQWSPEFEDWAWNYKRGEEAKRTYTHVFSLPSFFYPYALAELSLTYRSLPLLFSLSLSHHFTATEIHSAIPQDIDLLITHTPPYTLGNLDAIHDGTPVGCEELTRRLTAPSSSAEAIRPLLHVFGHIHEARGVHLLSQPQEGKEGEDETVLVNAALVEYDQDKWNKQRICKSQARQLET